MLAIIISVVLLAILILIAIRFVSPKRPDEPTIENNLGTTGPLIHASGIYSIVRKSPRDNLISLRPKEPELVKYLASLNVDIFGKPLSESDKRQLLALWKSAMEKNIRTVEQGDCEDVGFYYLDAPKERPCAVCNTYFNQGQYVTREEIFSAPSVIPPFHLGCTTRIVPYHGKEDLRDTAIIGMAPLFKNHALPPLPEWKKTVKTI
ncbi:MAG: hypothetical protein JXA71_19755 [Chitinispirillaceae bacterium]|nr:hypothetical protein [Chitinispirillaceae bacterium]